MEFFLFHPRIFRPVLAEKSWEKLATPLYPLSPTSRQSVPLTQCPNGRRPLQYMQQWSYYSERVASFFYTGILQILLWKNLQLLAVFILCVHICYSHFISMLILCISLLFFYIILLFFTSHKIWEIIYTQMSLPPLIDRNSKNSKTCWKGDFLAEKSSFRGRKGGFWGKKSPF